MLMNAVCIVPGILNALTRDRTDPRFSMKIILDVLAVSAQATAFVVWPLLDGAPVLWAIPVACVFASLGWWENFVSTFHKNPSGIVFIYLLNVVVIFCLLIYEYESVLIL